MRANDKLPALTHAQAMTLHHMWQGDYQQVRSGRHLKRLAQLGLIARTTEGRLMAGRYEPTEYAREVLTRACRGSWRNYVALHCSECGQLLP